MKNARQDQTPLLDAMRAYAASGAVAYHTPGHKQGKGIHPSFKDVITETGLKMEVSLMEELDNLHAPETYIKDAQELAARLYGADASYFMVNGTTGAIQTMLLTALGPGDRVIVPRNAHRSIIGGIILCGAIPVYVQPQIDEALGIAMAVTPEAIAKAIERHPDCKAALVVSPTYYGAAADLRAIADIVHARDMLLLVDEAHGPHLKFHAGLPLQAIDAGADLAAQSTHKILGSLTQTSMLHVRFGRVDAARLNAMASLIQTTSPNYLLMASLDVARMQMATEGEKLIARAVELATKAREEIRRIDGLACFGEERIDGRGVFALDVTKLTVTVNGLGISGAEAERILSERYGIKAELSDAYNVLFIISLGDGPDEVRKLTDALRGLARRRGGAAVKRFSQRCACPPIPPMRMSPREALFAETRSVEFSKAAGMVSAEMITFYPPGIPVLCPGEVISDALIAHCLEMRDLGLSVVGPGDRRLHSFSVVK